MYFYLPLYSYKSGNVEAQSGLNQGHAAGRPRDCREVYIPIPSAFYRKMGGTPFPPRDTYFSLVLPDNSVLTASICQDGDKALMSNPNSTLGHWLIGNVLGVTHNNTITNQDLINAGYDSVRIVLGQDGRYYITPASLGSFSAFMNGTL